MPVALFGITDPTVLAATVAGIVAGLTAVLATFTAGPLRLWVDTKLQRSKAKTDYEFTQRNELRSKVGTFRGRLLEAATSLNYRLNNLRENRRQVVGPDCSEDWLDVQGDYRSGITERYYFRSSVYRLMALLAVANRFERSAIYVDPRYAEPEDERIVFYVRALRWGLTDPKLFASIEPQYKQSQPTDHFYTDDIRRMCAALTRADDELLDLHHLEAALEKDDESLLSVFEFFDGLKEGSLKWDRLMVFHLLLKGFINVIGYSTNRSDQGDFDAVALTIERPQIARNALEWLPRLGLSEDNGALMICKALMRRLESDPGSTQSSVRGGGDDGVEPQV